MARRKQPDSQSDLPFSRAPDISRTMEIHCGNCGASFIALYGTEEDATTELVDTDKCGLCGGDPFKKEKFKDSVLRLMAQVMTRNIKTQSADPKALPPSAAEQELSFASTTVYHIVRLF